MAGLSVLIYAELGCYSYVDFKVSPTFQREDLEHSRRGGFLSDETDAVIERIRRTNGSWLSELCTLNKLMVQSQYLLNVHIESTREVVCSALYVRSLMHSQAAVLLIERGMDASARAVIRCAMEGLFNRGRAISKPLIKQGGVPIWT
jgi:hypothetical protein